MPVRTLLFALAFVACCVGSLVSPIWGLLGYVAHYCIGPERQWWEAPLSRFGIRYSLTLAAATMVGIVAHWGKLRYGKTFLTGQEKLLFLFLVLVWASTLLGGPTEGRYTTVDPPSIKLAKVFIFCLMLTHVVTDLKDLNRLYWVLTLGTLILGLEAYNTPRRAFQAGRLETIGGPDFQHSNVLAAHMVAMLPLIGAQFLRSRWIGKVITVLAGAFAVNTVVLTRTRGAVVGVAGAVIAALALSPGKHRAKIIAGVAAALVGGFFLVDPGFLNRAGTLQRSQEEMDVSARSRLEIWKGSLQLLKDHPLGVGAGNFHQNIGRYVPEMAGRDAHNTFVRCYSELGVQGITVLGVLVLNAIYMLRKVIRDSAGLPKAQHDSLSLAGYGLAVSIVAMLCCGLTSTVLYTEAMWWLLAMPVCLWRALENLKAPEVELATAAKSAKDMFGRDRSAPTRGLKFSRRSKTAKGTP